MMDFAQRLLPGREVAGKRVIELGRKRSGLRSSIEPLGVTEYVEAKVGQNVDDVLSRYDTGSFDIVISTGMVENARNWRAAVYTVKALCAPSALLVVTTGKGRWQFDPANVRAVFADYSIEALDLDPIAIAARKGTEPLTDLSQIELVRQ